MTLVLAFTNKTAVRVTLRLSGAKNIGRMKEV
jgi:hypothetical protein